MIERAAFWAAQLATDEATQEDRDACETWCREHPLHRLTMERMRGLDAQIDSTDDIGRETMESILERRPRAGRWLGGLLVGLVFLIGGGWLTEQSLTVRALFPDYKTAHGEQRAVKLADGSDLTIDTSAALDFHRGAGERKVTLFRGQILIRVAADASHPFIVETQDGTATALGTAFTVRRDHEATTVTVIKSKVRVCPAEMGSCTDLLPGDQARMRPDTLERLGRVDPKAASMWAEGWLVADDQPVAHVLLELNRYLRHPVSFDAPELADVRVSGSFPLTDPDRALQGILRSTGLRMSSTAEGAPVVSRAK